MAATKKNKETVNPPATVQNFPIVGIGASAGGLDAFKRLLNAIPEKSGMAYVLVQHLDPNHDSILPEILQRVTKIPVLEITDNIHLAPDHIYVIPSSKILFSTDGILKLIPREKKPLNQSIDIFFTSLAEVHKECAVGIVLSGTGSDGTLGLKAIKENGGISIAQDFESAAYDSMPQSAVNAGVVDFILTPEDIPAQLLEINKTFKTSHFYNDVEELPKDDDYIFKQILSLLRQRRGVDFTYYKQPTFHRRIARRIAIVKKKDLSDYLNYLRSNESEQDELFQDVLIPVTSFFRDPKTFQALTDTVFPVLFENKTADEPIRVWIAGCSTGEEAYSIAISLHEYVKDHSPLTYREGLGVRIQIFASDISEKAIKKARTGIYSKSEVENISSKQLDNYFIKNNNGFELNKLIRDMCVFAPHNFLKDPPFAKMDLISCRNVLIYMDTFLQKKAFATFHYALKGKGFLLLGKSETTGNSSDLFAQVNKHEKIYTRKPAAGRFMNFTSERKEESLAINDIHKSKNEIIQTDFRKSAEAVMIAKSPAGVVVNAQMDIVHIHGDISPYLEAPQGRPTHNLIKMAREGLAFELRNAIHKSIKENTIVSKEDIVVKANDKQYLVSIEIIPLTDTVEPHQLIRFEKKIIPVILKIAKSSSERTVETQKRNEQLEKEISQTLEDMRSITEDMEASNEELQSSNEELQSSNEEMQSLNEELETSKEELQSTNEELLIVNQELLDKQEQLNASRVYSEAIVTTLREPLVVLDKSLRVKTANASFYKKFNVDENEIENKLFYEIQNYQFDNAMLRSLLEKILPLKNRIEDFEISIRIPEKGERIILLNAREIINEKKSEQLILLAFEDITDRVLSERILKESEARSRALVESNIVAVCFTRMDNAIIFDANPAFLKMLGFTKKDLKEGKINWLDFTPPEFHLSDYQALEKAKSMEVSPPYEKDIMHTDGSRLSVIKSKAIINNNEVMSVFVDISKRKTLERELQIFSDDLEEKIKERTKELLVSNEDLKQTNLQLDQFAYIASHDLQEPLRKITTFSMRLLDKHKDDLSADVKSYLNKIQSSSLRMRTLIQDLLEYSRLLQHEKKYSKTDLNKTLKDVINDFELLIHEKKAKIKSGKLPVIDGISLQMNQLFCNIISNSLKFSNKDIPPIITISSRKLTLKEIKENPLCDPAQTYFEIIFKDNGIGFKQKYAKQIFTIFQRLHNNEMFTGTGIGLALCRRIMDNHHGQISANSIENKGSEFHVILPLTQPGK
ncbi:MAG: PAS domain S-box protein [Bacteroidia bacterium]|nr:PAS domain S-box protein [Bacteroidia bacterium]